MKKLIFPIAVFLLLFACSKDDPVMVIPNPVPDNSGNQDPEPDGNNDTSGFLPCLNGMAGVYPCRGYNLLDRIPLDQLNAGSANDVWGWTDPMNGKEYALIGLDNGTAFIDISDNMNMVYLGKLSTATQPSAWRDIKVYQDHAFIVSEAPAHGMQVFDLTRLRDVTNPPETFTADGHYTGIGHAHNIAINEDSGTVFIVGTDHDDIYNGGVHFLDVQDPVNPLPIGGYGASGFSHDAQVVTYNGPDSDYQGQEIFVGANESAVVIVNVTDKTNPILISEFTYPNIQYAHQGWFTPDQRYFLLGDELDEANNGINSRTLIFDMTDLDVPTLHTSYYGPTRAIDHNGYVRGNTFYLANYTAGIRSIDLTNLESQTLRETGYFDTYPDSDDPGFDGVWSVYPFFTSGKIIASDITGGLFVLTKSGL